MDKIHGAIMLKRDGSQCFNPTSYDDLKGGTALIVFSGVRRIFADSVKCIKREGRSNE